MAIEVLTREDLHEFRILLLNDIKTILNPHLQNEDRWLKSPEVRQILNISVGTLQNMRLNGTIAYTKIGGIIYYSYKDIIKLFANNKVNDNPVE